MNMPDLAVLAGAMCVIAWIYILAGRALFWRVRLPPAALPTQVESGGLIAAIIPARNETDVIGASVTSLLRQSGAGLRLFVVDDNSTDGTADIARSAAARHGGPGTLTVIAGQPLPSGWTGKLWALQQGIEQALTLQPQFLLLTDADIEHSPQSIATLAAIAEQGEYDLASFMVKLHCHSVAEKLLIPAFVFFFFLLYPPKWICDSGRKTAGAAGGCMLIRPEALQRAGGMAAIRSEIIDDCALAAAVKRNGGKVWLGLKPDTRSLRSYGSFARIEGMIARTAFNQLRHSAWVLMGALAGMVLVFLLPVALLFSRWWMLGAGAYALMLIGYLPMVRFYGINLLWALTLPASAAFYMFATVHSALRYWSGRGGEWKGRAQDAMNRG